MGIHKQTTRDLFKAIADTERARSAKADSVFRQLRQGLNDGNHAPPSASYTSDTSPSIDANHISTMMKFAARQSV